MESLVLTSERSVESLVFRSASFGSCELILLWREKLVLLYKTPANGVINGYVECATLFANILHGSFVLSIYEWNVKVLKSKVHRTERVKMTACYWSSTWFRVCVLNVSGGNEWLDQINTFHKLIKNIKQRVILDVHMTFFFVSSNLILMSKRFHGVPKIKISKYDPFYFWSVWKEMLNIIIWHFISEILQGTSSFCKNLKFSAFYYCWEMNRQHSPCSIGVEGVKNFPWVPPWFFIRK